VGASPASVSAFPKMKYLMLSLDSGRLYLLDRKDLQRSTVLCGAYLRNSEYAEVIDLKSALVLAIPREMLGPHLVPDSLVCQELRSAGISGLHPTICLQDDARSAPLAGNLNDPSWLSVSLSGRCNFKCVFCYTEFIRNDPELHFLEVVKSLERGREAGIEVVVFSGGEPTLSNDLGKYIRLAQQLGYAQIGIQTNGYRLARKNYLRSLVDAGLSGVLVSLHAPDPIVHDHLAGTPQSFRKATEALKNLADESVATTINCVVCRANGSLAVRMVGFVAQLIPNAALRFSFLIVEGAAYDNRRKILPTLPEFIDWIRPALLRAQEIGLPTEVENVPPCVSHVLGKPVAYSLSQRRSLMQASPFYRAERPRGELDVKLEACHECSMSMNCAGLQMAYLANVIDGARHVYPIKDTSVAA
jgi:MoaA/NifB/PqqE/SkfB family radical SAM enzyme